MRRMTCAMFLIALCAMQASAEPKTLVSFDGLALPEAIASLGAQPEVSITFDPAVSSTGRGSVRISCNSNEPTDAMILQIPLTGAGTRVIWFTVRWKSDTMHDHRAYLEMLVTFADGKTYFSRGLAASQVVTGTTEWKTCRIPFYLKESDRAVSVKAGVRFEGQGTVYLDSAVITEEPRLTGLTPGSPAFSGLIAGILGSLVGLLGAACGILAPTGKYQKLVMGLLMGAFALSAFMVLAGFSLLLSGLPWAACQSLVSAGVICAMVVLLVSPQVKRTYRRAEEERMKARDDAENL